ncbi:uncharacterized protein F5147DRAFT_580430, partial [Suillus discolor]
LESHFPRVRDACTTRSRTLPGQGCNTYISQPAIRKLPLSLDGLTLVVDAFATSDIYDDISFVAMLVTGFKTLQRLGELVWPDTLKIQSYRKVVVYFTFTLSIAFGRA